MGKKLLEGVRVVELANFIAAATAGRFLADAGADVIKVESAKGDPCRFTAVAEGRPFDSLCNPTWELENAGKRCVSFNTKDPDGKEALFKLLDTADILITNWRLNALKRAGLDYETLKQRYPKLVYAIVTGYGEGGPDSDLPGFDFTAFFGRGGYLELTRQASGRPFNLRPGTGDHNVGMNLAAGILAALYHAKMTGEGEKVECSLYASAVFNLAMAHQCDNYAAADIYPMDADKLGNPLNSSFKTKDNRYIVLCFPNYDTYYATFIQTIGLGELVGDERYSPLSNLIKNGTGPEIFDIVCKQFETKTAAEWMPILQGADLPVGLAYNSHEVMTDPQGYASGILCDFTYPNGETRTLIRQPVRYQEMGLVEYKLGPDIGEHSEEILKELGYSDEKIAEMKAKGTYYVYDKASFKASVSV